MNELEQIELQLARAESARAAELRERILSTVSHEVKGTLSTILLWERVLRERFDEPGLRERALDAIRQSATAQSEAVTELAHVARLLGGTTALDYERFALEIVLAMAVELQAAAARVRAVEVHADYRAPLGLVYADRQRLRRAFEVLVETRARATPPGNSFTVAARRKNDTVSIVVGDVETEPATDEAVPALDLPLVVVGEVLALHGGSLDVTRPAGGGPLTFWIRLPVAPPA